MISGFFANCLLVVHDRQNLAISLTKLQNCYATDTHMFFAGALPVLVRAAQRPVNALDTIFQLCRQGPFRIDLPLPISLDQNGFGNP